MKLIFGGAYQGKLDYALKHFDADASVYQCADTELEIDFSKTIVNSLHRLVLAQLRNGIDPCRYIEEHLDRLQSTIVICDDISCGVVPMDAEMRAWREAVGRVLMTLAKHSEKVVRVFCGLGTQMK